MAENNRFGVAEVNETQLRWEMAGAGEWVVLLHGFGADARVWDEQWDALAAAHRVVRYDLRGFGRSAPADERPYRSYEDLAGLMDCMDIPAAHLVGQSAGCTIAVDFALVYPERVLSLTLVDPTVGGYRWSDEWVAGWMSYPELLKEGGPAALVPVLLDNPMFDQARKQPAAIERLREMFLAYSGWHLLNPDPEELLDPPAIERLAEVRAPALVVLGELEPPDFHTIADILSKGIPGAQKVVLQGVGHVAPLEAPDAVNGAILAFLNRATNRAR
jgi:3-oxoadipate enol-lactonase